MTVREQSQPVDTEHADTRATAQKKAQEQEKQAHGAGVTGKLGSANLERNGDGSIVIDSDKVDNPH